MKFPLPNEDMVRLALEGYAEDGVSGKPDYDSKTKTWYANLNDAEYEQYIVNLRLRHSEVLKDFGSIDWHDATNIQGAAIEPSKDNENRLSLYLLDCNCKTAKGFKIIGSLTELMKRKNRFIYVGSTCVNCGKKTMVVITWEDVKPK